MKTLLLTIFLTITTSVAAAVFVTDISTSVHALSANQHDNTSLESVYKNKILMAVAEPVSIILPLSQPSR